MTKIIFDASGSWIPPPGVEILTKIEVWAAGGAGGINGVFGAGGGGGGAYSKIVNHSVAAESRAQTAIPVTVGPAVATTAGADSWFRSAATVMAKGGGVGGDGQALSGGTAGTGGAAGSGVGTTKTSGGNGAAGSAANAGGGGGGSGGDTTSGGTSAAATGGAAGTTNGAAGGNHVSNGFAPGGGGGGQIAANTRGGGAPGRVIITYEEAGTVISISALSAGVQSISDVGSNISLSAFSAGAERISDVGSNASLSSFQGADSVSDSGVLVSTSLYSSVQSILEIGNIFSTNSLIGTESIFEAGSVTSINTYGSTQAIADKGINTSLSSFTASALIQDTGVNISTSVFTQVWQRISPGLSGIVYNANGSTPQVGAQVLIFRDDTNALIASLTSDAAGAWATNLDSNFTYWISGHKAGSPQIKDRTDRAISTVNTVVQSGTQIMATNLYLRNLTKAQPTDLWLHVVGSTGGLAVPTANIVSQTRTKISRVVGFDSTDIVWNSDAAFTSYQFRVVASGSDPVTSGVLVEQDQSPSAGGNSGTQYTSTLTDGEIEAVSSAEGVKVVKVFVQNSAGWSS